MIVRTRRPDMSEHKAGLIAAFDRYIELSFRAALSINKKLSIVEAQKVAYFLQAAGWPLGIKFVPSFYGPYSQELDRFISDVEGHYMTGYGDGTGGSKATLELHPDAVDEAWSIVGDSVEFRAALQKFENIIEGFEFPYGIELLSTVHYVAHHTSGKITADVIISKINNWSERKRSLFRPTQASAAFQHLVDHNAVLG